MSGNENILAEGKHVQLFRAGIRRVFDDIFSHISADDFKDIYGKHFKQNWSRADALYKVWIDAVQDSVMKDLDYFIQEGKVNEKLEKLADITNKCDVDRRTLAWRPTGIPEEDFRAHRMQEKLKKQKKLEEFVNNKELEVMQLKNEILAGRAKVQALDSELQQLALNLESDHDRYIQIELSQKDNFKKLT